MINPDKDLYLERAREYIIKSMPLGKECYISEVGLAEKLGINRSAARKALLSLEGEGCVRSTTKGYQRIDYSQTSFRVGWVMRRALEHQAAGLVATEASDRELFELSAICDEMDFSLDRQDIERFTALDLEFHRTLVNASHDPLLIRMMSMVMWTLRITSKDTYDIVSQRKAQQAHRQLLNAVRSRDAVLSGYRAYEHMAGSIYGGAPGEKVPLPLPDSILEKEGIPPAEMILDGQPLRRRKH